MNGTFSAMNLNQKPNAPCPMSPKPARTSDRKYTPVLLIRIAQPAKASHRHRMRDSVGQVRAQSAVSRR